MHASGVEEKKHWDDDEEPAPDSSVRPTQPPTSAPPTPRSAGSVKIGSIRPQSSMSVTVSIAVSPELMVAAGAGGWYVTIARVDGPLLFEGALDDLGVLEALVMVPCGARAVKVLIESATKYKDAIVAVSDEGIASHTFA